MRAHGLRRLGAWLAIVAIGVHVVAMAVHHSASAAPLPDPMTALCISTGDAPADALAHPDGKGEATQHVRFCPFCETLHAGAPLPQSTASVAAPLIPVAGPALVSAPIPPSSVTLGDISRTGPPSAD
jgi:Protein of unknown function (DUF2946)